MDEPEPGRSHPAARRPPVGRAYVDLLQAVDAAMAATAGVFPAVGPARCEPAVPLEDLRRSLALGPAVDAALGEWRAALRGFEDAAARLEDLDHRARPLPQAPASLGERIRALRAARAVLEERACALRDRVAEAVDRTREGASMSEERVWTVEIVFTEDEDRTRADARLRAGDREWHGWGRARRNPIDPDVPAIGEELAASRALVDLSHQLLHAAADAIESFEGRPVQLRA